MADNKCWAAVLSLIFFGSAIPGIVIVVKNTDGMGFCVPVWEMTLIASIALVVYSGVLFEYYSHGDSRQMWYDVLGIVVSLFHIAAAYSVAIALLLCTDDIRNNHQTLYDAGVVHAGSVLTFLSIVGIARYIHVVLALWQDGEATSVDEEPHSIDNVVNLTDVRMEAPRRLPTFHRTTSSTQIPHPKRSWDPNDRENEVLPIAVT